MWTRGLLEDDDAPRRGGRMGGLWEDFKKAVIQPVFDKGIETIKAPIEETATKSSVSAAVIGGLVTAGVVGAVLAARR